MLRRIAFLLALIAPAAAQTAPPAAAGVNQIVPNISHTVEDTRVNLARLRIDKWKAKGDAKEDAQQRVQALQRNMTEALPALINAVRQNSQSSNAAFKLYRNVDVLYDVMSNLVESAGAFGAKEEYLSLAQDLNQFDQERHALGDALDAMTAQKDTEVARMQQAAHRAQAEAAPPKTIVIDDTAPEKPVKKKSTRKSTTKKTAPPK